MHTEATAAPRLGALGPDDPTRIGGYRIVGKVGAGGMGTVYAGAVPEDGSYVAVKLIHPEFADDTDFRSRFAREISLLSRVDDRCVPALLKADPHGDPPWLVTEFVAGQTLDAYVREHGPLSPGLLHGLAVGVAEALRSIHALGVVHRDLKPGNVILAPDGPKLLDFGIARAAGEAALTRTGGLVGTPGWAAPELYRAESLTGAGDVFSWGALLLFAATGRTPFGTASPDVLAYRALREEPDLSGLSKKMRPLVAAAMDKDPDARPAPSRLLTELTGVAAPVTPRDDGADEVTTVVGQVLDQQWNHVTGVDPAPPRTRVLRNGKPWNGRRRWAALGVAAGAVVLSGAIVAALLGSPFGGTDEGGSDGGAVDADAADGDGGPVAWDPPEAATEGRNPDHESQASIETADAEQASLSDVLSPGDEYASLVHRALTHRRTDTVNVSAVEPAGAGEGDGVEFTASVNAIPVGEGPEAGFSKLTVVTPEGHFRAPENIVADNTSYMLNVELTVAFDGAPPQGLLALIDEEYVENAEGAPPVGVCYDAETGEFSVDFDECL
ncbi:serine/threonine protein kinase [Nocardiopsis sp. HNM0947]|uniref:Serine/threonine protein kinase n=1 Tax=Nocardiopsis coralli TaxID=2772213 RepID=A0ABR9PB13_9ACTN|nr:serine/threonine-protein kinase [Nocardiopsis coralli]MBE3001020.1 serine/threonine protein kinase [Nocardiopsis coralli]